MATVDYEIEDLHYSQCQGSEDDCHKMKVKTDDNITQIEQVKPCMIFEFVNSRNANDKLWDDIVRNGQFLKNKDSLER